MPSVMWSTKGFLKGQIFVWGPQAVLGQCLMTGLSFRTVTDTKGSQGTRAEVPGSSHVPAL